MLKHEDVKIKERTFRISKFNALKGSLIIKKLSPLFLKAFNSKDVDLETQFSLDKIADIITELKDEDFIYIQKECLLSTKEVLAGNTPNVLDEYGNFGVQNLEDDVITVLAIMGHVLWYNIKGFLDGSPLTSLMGQVPNIFQQGSKT